MDFEELMRNMGSGSAVQPGQDVPTVDTSEIVYISSLALLKVRRLDIFRSLHPLTTFLHRC